MFNFIIYLQIFQWQILGPAMRTSRNQKTVN